MAAGGDLDAVVRLERLLFSREVRGSPDAATALLADGFVEFTRSGAVCRRDEVLDRLAAESGDRPEPTACDFALTPLAQGVVLLTYRTSRARGDGGELHTLRSSIWRRTDGCWRMLFHQGTPATRA